MRSRRSADSAACAEQKLCSGSVERGSMQEFGIRQLAFGMRYLAFGMMILAAGAMILCSLHYGNLVKQNADTMSVKYREGVLSAQEIEDKNQRTGTDGTGQEEIPYLTGWDRQEAVRVQNSSLGREAGCELLEVYGDMETVYPRGLLLGSFVGKVDKKGCVISLAAAEKLFQSSQVLGCEVRIGETEYVVRGVLPAKDPLMMIQSERDEKFPYLEFRYPDHQYAASNTKADLARWGFTAYESFIEGNLYAGIAGVLLGFPFLVILILLYIAFMDRIRKGKKQLWRCIGKGAAMMGFLLLLAVLVTYSVAFSDDYIPAKVSDFAFWTDKFRELQADYRGVIKFQLWYRESVLLYHLKCCFMTSAAAGVFCIGSKISADKNKHISKR